MLYVIKNGIRTRLDDGVLSYFIGDEGWGMAPNHRLVERGPLQHGIGDRGFRLDPRVGTLILSLVGSSRQDMYTKRDTLMRLFTPDNNPVSILFDLDTDRQIDCFFSSNMIFPSSSRDGFTQRVAISLLAPDPTFYDPVGLASSFDLGGGSDTLEVPTVVPMTVGASTLNKVNVIQYDGSWLTYPHLIRITGPITGAKITNESTGEILDFTGVTIAAANYYDINLLYGEKTIVNQVGTNKIADLDDDSDLATWHLAADPEVVGGSNSIRVEGTSITEATSVEISYFVRYIGR